MQNKTGTRRWRIGLALLGGSLLAVYLATLAPGLTWANGGNDGGDFISAAAGLGVAHPPGYPTYLLLARLFQFLPFGSLAYRTNLLSALSAAAAAVLVAILTRRYCGPPGRPAAVGGLVAGLAFGLSPLLWGQAVIAEAYALHGLFLALLLVSLDWPAGGWRDWGAGGLFGLALGNHLTTIFLLPPWLILAGWRAGRFQPAPCLRRCAGLALGLLVYLYVPLRAQALPPVNWGYAVNWEGVRWVLTAQPYQGLAFGLPADQIAPRVQTWAQLVIAQFSWPGMLVGFYGLFLGRARSGRVKGVTVWLAAAATIFAIGYNAPDSFVYLLPVFMAGAIWLGLGLATLAEQLRSFSAGRAAPELAGLCLLAVLGNAGAHWPEVDASRDTRAETFGRAVLNAAPPEAILFTQGDRDTFALWYFHFALRERPDVVVVVEPMLGFAWYRQNLRSIYPDVVLPDQPDGSWRAALTAANYRLACNVQLDALEVLVCR